MINRLEKKTPFETENKRDQIEMYFQEDHGAVHHSKRYYVMILSDCKDEINDKSIRKNTF